MLEILLIFNIIYAIQFFPMRGKTPDMLTGDQKRRVHSEYQKFMRTRKGRRNPNFTIDEFYPSL